MSYITVKNMSIGYNKKTITKNINFEINKGDYICVVGENGAGKTTLIKTLLKLIEPLEGCMSYSDELKNHQIGYLPQISEIQRDFPASVKEIVLSGIRNPKGKLLYKKEEIILARENMNKLDILQLQNDSFKQLSGGQKQRVLLARALCATDKILLLDEPVNGLDSIASENMYDIISKLNKDGVSILMVTHDLSRAINNASHILYISDTANFYTKEEFIESEDSPYRYLTKRGQ